MSFVDKLITLGVLKPKEEDGEPEVLVGLGSIDVKETNPDIDVDRLWIQGGPELRGPFERTAQDVLVALKRASINGLESLLSKLAGTAFELGRRYEREQIARAAADKVAKDRAA